jgi:hypothetical protein
VSDEVKEQVPDHIKEKAREMAQEELKRRLEELDMSASEAKGYGELLTATQAHILSLHDLLERASTFVHGPDVYLTPRYQTSPRRRRNVFGLSDRPTESLMTVD